MSVACVLFGNKERMFHPTGRSHGCSGKGGQDRCSRVRNQCMCACVTDTFLGEWLIEVDNHEVTCLAQTDWGRQIIVNPKVRQSDSVDVASYSPFLFLGSLSSDKS